MKYQTVYLVLTLFYVHAAHGDLVTINTPVSEPAEDDMATIYEASHRDILHMLYRDLLERTDADNIIPLIEPNLGYKWTVGRVKCGYRIVPTVGFDGYGRRIVGYFLDFSITGGLPVSALLHPKKSIEQYYKKCGGIYEEVVESLEDSPGGIQVTKFSPVGKYDDVHWVIEKPGRFITDIYGSNQAPQPTQ